jgi:hypothetical protein
MHFIQTDLFFLFLLLLVVNIPINVIGNNQIPIQRNTSQDGVIYKTNITHNELLIKEVSTINLLNNLIVLQIQNNDHIVILNQ